MKQREQRKRHSHPHLSEFLGSGSGFPRHKSPSIPRKFLGLAKISFLITPVSHTFAPYLVLPLCSVSPHLSPYLAVPCFFTGLFLNRGVSGSLKEPWLSGLFYFVTPWLFFFSCFFRRLRPIYIGISTIEIIVGYFLSLITGSEGSMINLDIKSHIP